jgi:3-oxoacyl-[acyl-carrier-protein] synthase I
MEKPIYLTCLSLISAVGLNPKSAAAAMRERIVGGVVPDMPEKLGRRKRLVELLARSYEHIEYTWPYELSTNDIPFILCTRGSVNPQDADDDILHDIESRLQLKHRTGDSTRFNSGSVAAFDALAQARRLFAASETDVCLIAAVDTLVDAGSLVQLDDTRRLKTAQQTDGIIPGEAACVVLASSKPMTATYVVVHGLGTGNESATVLNDEPLLGKGMSAAIKHALDESGLDMHDVDFRLSDVAGESFAFEELVIAQTRLTRKPRESQVLWHHADCIGDCGAANGLIQLSWAEQAFARGYAPGPVALSCASEPEGARAAAVVGAPDRTSG